MKKVLIWPVVLLSLLGGLAWRSYSPPVSPPGTVYADQIAVHGKVEIWTLDQAASKSDYYYEEDNFDAIAGGRYIPARNLFITQEFEGLVSDPTGYTDPYGSYYLKKSGLIQGEDYDVNLEVRAEAILGTYGSPLWPNNLTVSVFQDSTDLYEVNGETPAYTLHTGTDTEINIRIGGPQDSGISWSDDVYCDWTLSGCKGYRGEDDHKRIHPVVAFWMTQVLQDYVRALTRLAPNPDQINNDTWIIYPALNDTTHYGAYAPPPGIGSIDMSDKDLFPSQFGGQAAYSYALGENWRSIRQSLFHEYSHKIMHDVYWAMPEPNLNYAVHIGESEHDLETCASQELAWKEGFAEFLPAAAAGIPQVNGITGNGNIEHAYYPPQYLDMDGFIQNTPVSDKTISYPHDLGTIEWHYNVTRTCDEARKNEGEVAAVLWDIFDPQGWEYLNAAAQPVITFWNRPVMFNDRLEDPYLSDIWDELRFNEPDSINDEGYDTLASQFFDWSRLDSFWTDWIHTTYPDDTGQIHGLKAILYNRGIPSVLKPENAPVVEDVTIDAANRKLTFRVRELDPEDQPYLYFNIGYMKNRSDSEFNYFYSQDRLLSELETAWQDGVLTVSLDIPRGKLGRVNGVMVHDSMLTGYRGQNLPQNETNFNLACSPGQLSNFASGLAVQGSHAYVADMEDGLYIYDLSDPLKPARLALLRGDLNARDTPWAGAMDVAVQGNYAYLAAYSGADEENGALVVVDISRPASPSVAGYLELGGDPGSVALGANKAYVANGTGGMHVVDIRYPYSPMLETTLATAPAMDIILNGDRVYLGGQGGVQIFTLGTFPRLWGTISTPGEAVSGLAIGPDGLVYAVTREGSLKVFDISTWDPVAANLQPFMIEKADSEITDPILLAELPVHMLTGGAVLAGDRLVAGGDVIDVSDPELIYIAAENDDLSAAYDVGVQGDVIYAAAGTNGLQVFSPAAAGVEDACGSGGALQEGGAILEPAGVYQGHVNDMAFTRGYGYLASGQDGMKIVAVSPEGGIQEKGTYNQWQGGEPFKLNARGVETSADGYMAYLVSSKGDMQILDITIPESPFILGTVLANQHGSAGQWSDVAVTERFAYVCAGTGGLHGLDIRNPSNPPWQTTANTALNDCTDVTVHMPFVYALGSSSGLHVFELMGQDSNSMPDLYEVAAWKLPQGLSGSAYSSLYLDPQRRLLYVSALWNGVTVLDVSDPPHPQVLSSLDPGRAYGLALSGNYLYAGDDYVVHIIDVGDPLNLQQAGMQQLTDRYGLEISAINLKVYSGVLYVATDRNTLQAYRILK